MAKEKIKGTEWDEIIFPKPKTEEEQIREREFKRMASEYQKQIGQIESFFNRVFPEIKWG